MMIWWYWGRKISENASKYVHKKCDCFTRNNFTPVWMLMCLSAALRFRPVLLPFFEITQLICYIKSTFNDLTDIIFFCSHKFIQLYLSDYLQTLHGTFLKICTFIFVSWSIAIWFNLVIVNSLPMHSFDFSKNAMKTMYVFLYLLKKVKSIWRDKKLLYDFNLKKKSTLKKNDGDEFCGWTRNFVMSSIVADELSSSQT